MSEKARRCGGTGYIDHWRFQCQGCLDCDPVPEIAQVEDGQERNWREWARQVLAEAEGADEGPVEYLRIEAIEPLLSERAFEADMRAGAEAQRDEYRDAWQVEKAAVDNLRAQRDAALQALAEAADDLGKAANQFASMRESQKSGHSPSVQNNPEIFEAKEAKARAVLDTMPQSEEE